MCRFKQTGARRQKETLMKTLLCLVLSLGVISPAFGQAEMSPDVRMGVARVSMERAGVGSPTNPTFRLVIDETEAEIIETNKVAVQETFDLLGAELGIEWIGDAYHVWAYGRYKGGSSRSTFRVDDEIAVVKAQQTQVLSRSPRQHGVVPFFQSGERKFSENFAVTTLGDHEASLVIAGRVRLEIKWTIEPIVVAYACDAGGGTGITVVEIYTHWFDQPPMSTEGVELTVGGRSIPIAGTLLDNDLMRINIFVDSVDYQELFNGVAEWDSLPVRIWTTGPIPLLVREVAFPPRTWVGHC